jgi:glycosyltransferase involved in cell wall biosynthesis
MVVVGDGPMRQRLEAEHPRARFVGALRGSELARHYASADVFLFPSLTETFGNVTLEALASGLSVVAFDTAAAGLHLRNGVNGWLVPADAGPDGRDAFIAQVHRALASAHPTSPLRWEARQTANRLDWDTVLGQFEQRLRMLVRPLAAPVPHAAMA